MLLFRKLAALAALVICATGLTAGAASAAAVNALTSDDATAYTSAFQSAGRGDFDAADQAAAQVSDKSLLGYLQFQRLMWPAAKTTYAELTSWLHRYADLPVADRILQLARKRRPRGAPELRLPADANRGDPAVLKPASGARGQAAREAFYSGDVEGAYQLSLASGERWIAGLAAFRLKDYPAAMSKFQQVALDQGESEWTRSAAAYWAARAAIASGSPEFAPDFLRIATRSPATFYGMIAERELGLEAGADPQAYILAQAGFGPAPATGGDGEILRTAYTALSGPALARLVKTDVRAKRAVALAQIGRTAEAGQELRAGLATAETEAQRRLWTTLAIEINGPVEAPARHTRGFDPDDYPTPRLEPTGGFTVDKALVYALVRQESRFNPNAVSSAGAIGLMQLMPQAAARALGDDKILSDSSPLYDPATNLRAGQDYLQLLMQATGGDMLRAVAAYNGGPGTLLRTEQSVGNGDALLLMESMPAPETRAYVQKVMAAYWIYRRMFGERGRSLDAVASGTGVIDPRIDR